MLKQLQLGQLWVKMSIYYFHLSSLIVEEGLKFTLLENS